MPVPENIRITQLDLELNGGCNYKCEMCPQSEGREKDFLKKLPMDLLEKIIDEAKCYGVESVSLHGSGEPTLNANLSDAVRAVKSRNLRCIAFSNGYKLDEKLSRQLIESKIDILRISAVGSDQESYSRWMSVDAFKRVRKNVRRFIEINLEIGGNSEVHLYHLITDVNNIEEEAEAYRTNWVTYTGALAEIWLMHNWSGGYGSPYSRKELATKPERRSCGRPFTELLQVRAGGVGDHKGGVVACCMVLGKDASAILGHLDTESIKDVVSGRAYAELRAAHREGRFDDIPYCKDCDQLIDLPTSLIWSNIPGRRYGQSKISGDLDHRIFASM